MLSDPRISVGKLLKAAALFAPLEPQDLARIAHGACELEVPRGARLYRKGEPPRGLYVVISGQVKLLLHASGGAEKVVELVGAGGTFGETSIFLDRPHALTAEALTESRLVHVPKATVLRELERMPALTRGLILSLSRRVNRFLSDLESYTLKTGTERVAGYLAGALSEPVSGNQAELCLSAGKGVIASRLNLTQEHFSRVLRELSEEGLIRVAGRAVCILDIEGLRKRAAGEVEGGVSELRCRS